MFLLYYVFFLIYCFYNDLVLYFYLMLDIAVESEVVFLWIWCIIWLNGYLVMRFLLNCVLNCDFLTRGSSSVYRRNSVEFSIDFRVLEYFRNYCLIGQVGIFVFQTNYDIKMPYGFLAGFRVTDTHSKTHGSCHMSTFELGRDI